MKTTEEMKDKPAYIPEDLESSLIELTDSLEAIRRLRETGSGKAAIRTGAAAAAAIAAILAGTSIHMALSRPDDTFDDPHIAYAEVRKAVMLISEAMSSGAEESDKVIRAFERQKEMSDKLTR